MLGANFKNRLKLVTLLVLGFCLNSLTARAGGDVYQIFLNNKLVLKQLVIEPINLKNLPLLNASDELIVHYSHCGAVGKARSIAIKDEKGKTYKEWKFEDATGSNTGMKVPVQDLMELQKKNASVQLNLYYTSEQLPKGRSLALLSAKEKSST